MGSTVSAGFDSEPFCSLGRNKILICFEGKLRYLKTFDFVRGYLLAVKPFPLQNGQNFLLSFKNDIRINLNKLLTSLIQGFGARYVA